MTHDEGVKWLESIKQDIGQIRHEDLWHYEQAISEIQELLKEQEAVEPDPVHNSSRWFNCGKCGCSITIEDRFCPRCGKRIEWKGR